MKQKKAAHTPFLPPSPLLPLGRDTPVLAVGAATLAFHASAALETPVEDHQL